MGTEDGDGMEKKGRGERKRRERLKVRRTKN